MAWNNTGSIVAFGELAHYGSEPFNSTTDSNFYLRLTLILTCPKIINASVHPLLVIEKCFVDSMGQRRERWRTEIPTQQKQFIPK